MFASFKENFATFQNCLKIYRIFREKIWAKIYKYEFVWVGGRSPEASEMTKNLVQ